MNVRHEPREHGGLIARPGAYFERAVAGLRPDQLRHQCDDVGLRDRLPLADRQRSVDVGAIALGGWDEQMARHPTHGLDDARVADIASDDLLANHRFAGRIVRGVVQCSHLISAAEARQGRQARP